MKQGGQQRNAWGGFTIVETLIVLAVTGVMLLSVIALISGKQNKTEFDQGINQVVSQLQQQAHDVSIGYYPDITNLSCSASGSLNFSTGAAAHGANQGCVYLGKVLQFGLNANANSNAQYSSLVLAGCQFTGCLGAAPSATLVDAKPAVIYPTDAHPSYPNASEVQDLQNGLQLVRMCYFTDAAQAYAPDCTPQTTAFAILQSQASYSQGGSACNGFCSGSQQFSLYGIQQSPAMPIPSKQLAALVSTSTASIVPAAKVVMCLKSGSTDQSGLVTIDGEGGSVTLQVKNGGTCS